MQVYTERNTIFSYFVSSRYYEFLSNTQSMREHKLITSPEPIILKENDCRLLQLTALPRHSFFAHQKFTLSACTFTAANSYPSGHPSEESCEREDKSYLSTGGRLSLTPPWTVCPAERHWGTFAPWQLVIQPLHYQKSPIVRAMSAAAGSGPGPPNGLTVQRAFSCFARCC